MEEENIKEAQEGKTVMKKSMSMRRTRRRKASRKRKAVVKCSKPSQFVTIKCGIIRGRRKERNKKMEKINYKEDYEQQKEY